MGDEDDGVLRGTIIEVCTARVEVATITDGHAREMPGAVDEWDVNWRRAWQSRRSRPDEALAVAQRLRDDAELAGDERRRGRALLLVGSCQGRLGDHEQAMRALHGALTRLEEPGTTDHALALVEMGLVHCLAGDHAASIERLLAALDIFQALDDDDGRANALNNLGMVFFHRGDFDEAAQAYEQAAEIRARIGDDESIAGTHNNLAKVLTALGRHEQALEHLGASCRLWERIGDWRGLGIALANTGTALEGLGDVRSAERYYTVAISLLDSTGHLQAACEVRCRLGRLHTRNGDLEKGMALLERAGEDADRLGAAQEQTWVAQGMAEVYEACGRHDEALRWYKRYHERERALFDERSQQRLLGLQAAFQLDRAERDSNTDPLTGLPNRRYLDRRLREELLRSRTNGTPLSVAICDLDYFKSVNDTYSHAVGDEVLRRVAELLRNGIRRSDFCARYGGEEFVVVLTDCARSRAARIADALRRSVREYPWEQTVDGLALTATIGVAETSEADGLDELLAIADHRLYAAKRAGKDRVESGAGA